MALLLALVGGCQDELELDMPVQVGSQGCCTVVLVEEVKLRGKGARLVPAAGASAYAVPACSCVPGPGPGPGLGLLWRCMPAAVQAVILAVDPECRAASAGS